MGWLGGETKITLATQVTRVIKDDLVPNSAVTGTQRAIFNNGDITEYLLEETVGSLGVRADRMYDYARDHYTYGLPSWAVHTSLLGQDEVAAVLASIEGHPVTIDYCHASSPNALHIGWMKAISDYGYNPATNQLATLSAQKGKPVYLDDLVVRVPQGVNSQDPNLLTQWGTPAVAGYTPWRPNAPAMAKLAKYTLPQADIASTQWHVVLYYVWDGAAAGGVPVKMRESITLAIDNVNLIGDYFHVKYTVAGVTKYWLYAIGSGTYPAIDAVFQGDPNMGQFYPFAYFRFNRQDDTTDHTSEAYRTTKKMVKFLGMDYDKVAEAINSNPDIGNVEQAILTMAVPAETQDPMEQKYLFDFFDRLAEAVDIYDEPAIDPRNGQVYNNDFLTRSAILMQDKRFKLMLTNSGIRKTLVAGTIGPVGSYASAVGEVVFAVPVGITVLDTDGNPTSDTVSDIREYPSKAHIYRKQVNEGQYEEISVTRMATTYFYDNDWASVSTESASAPPDILMVPLDHSITVGYSLLEREKLYARSLHFVFNSKIYTHVSWYETDFFQFLIIVVAVVITVWSWGQSYQALVAALAAGSSVAVETAILGILDKILTQLAISELFKLFVKLVGIKVGIIVAIVTFIASESGLFDSISIAGVPMAEDLLRVSSNLVAGVKSELQDEMKALMTQFDQLGQKEKEAAVALDKANALLEGNSHLSPLVIFGEKPDDFFNRTVHSGNIGLIGISAISSYVDNALDLSTLHESVGGYSYG